MPFKLNKEEIKMNRPLWQRARKDFIRLVDDDKIPEEHKRLNLHYLRTLPYEAISTAKPIIVEAPEPEPEPEPLGALVIQNNKLYGQIGGLGIIVGNRDYYERDARKQLNNYTDSVDRLRQIIVGRHWDFISLGVLRIAR